MHGFCQPAKWGTLTTMTCGSGLPIRPRFRVRCPPIPAGPGPAYRTRSNRFRRGETSHVMLTAPTGFRPATMLFGVFVRDAGFRCCCWACSMWLAEVVSILTMAFSGMCRLTTLGGSSRGFLSSVGYGVGARYRVG
jgi:hypothetical protein